MTPVPDLSIARVLDRAAPMILDALADRNVPRLLRVSPSTFAAVERIHREYRVEADRVLLLGVPLVMSDSLDADDAVLEVEGEGE
jgi:hypothetical protein